MANTIDPASLSSPSSPPSPAPSTSDAGPSRKRPRSEVSSEERKEARAHRNRIAAQNSRDRRKAHFSFLEHRVNELEEENRQLRISIGLLSQGQPTPALPLSITPSTPTPIPVAVSMPSAGDLARERENVELKERIRTLERGWDAVVKALAAQGLPTGLAPGPTATATAPLPTTPAAALPSPAPSHSSLDIDLTSPSTLPSMPVLVPTSSTSTSPNHLLAQPQHSVTNEEKSTTSTSQDSTRHPARMASTQSNSVALQRSALFVDTLGAGLPSSQTAQNTIDEQAMEELFREILVPVPSGEAMNSGEQEQQEEGDKGNGCDRLEENGDKDEKMDLNLTNDDLNLSTDGDSPVDWASEIGMQKFLDSITVAHQTFINPEFSMNDAGLELLSWNEAEGMGAGVDVF